MRLAALALATVVMVIALVVLVIGWGAGVEELRRIRPGFAAMVPSTAFSFVLTAGVILLHVSRLPVPHLQLVARIAGALIVVIAVLDLIVLSLPDANGLDMLLWPDAEAFQTASMATATAICFLLAGICLWRLHRPRDATDRVYVSCATLGLVLSGIALTGYAFDSAALYQVSIFTAMALHTALAFVAIFGAFLLKRPQTGWVSILRGSEGGSESARRLLPGAIVLPFVLCLVALYATNAGWVNANSRLSVLAIAMMVLMSAAILHYAAVQNRIERALRATVADRDLLLREVYHRVKNNLQMTTALLRIGMNRTQDQTARTLLSGTIKRVESIGIVHRLLISANVPSELTAEVFLRELCSNIVSGRDADGKRVELEIKAGEDLLHIETAVTLGLLINEVITNSLKHAFPGERNGKISVAFHRVESGDGLLVISDNGIGFDAAAQGATAGMGSSIIEGLVGQLDGELTIKQDNGTTTSVRIPAATFEDRRYDG